ncbi:MarR family winged helix-turn-helix transcriptional regulator [Actomonas aquatica]|uniref:MarR family winged helix-turn-helix transcriptional regulator n=1 Tax=Actomonas aquatica TaxID=2866162 RepID=A0ABZ1C6I4_9BACT|nr:MarR family winged helix-turn-helix transcriptional regulator [Opitutus sp. WL0086]WRQ87003.1 MarR family winged helix-turn-helix transcriptional regulator [Opitutus sp. WL0086]
MEPTAAQCQAAAEACACFNIRRTARLVTHVYDEALAPLKVSSGQFVILLAARILDAGTMQELAEAVSLDRSALSRSLRPLVARGLLSINVGQDRRRREVSITADGMQLLADGAPHWQQAQDRMQAALGGNGFEGLLRMSKDSFAALSA